MEMFLHRRQQVLPATLYRKRNGRVRGRIAQGLRYLRREDRAIYSGLPDADLIYDIALAYAADTDNNTITFEVETTDSQLPALYTIGKDGVAKRGMEVDTESIKGVSLLKQK